MKTMVSRVVSALGVCSCLASGVVCGQPPAGKRVEQPDVRVEAALTQAESQRVAGDFDRALETLRGASSLVKKTKGNDHPDLLPILDAAGQILFEQGKLPEAEVPLARAVSLRDSLIEAGEEWHGVPQAAELLLLGKIHAAAGRVDRMLSTMKRALAMLDAAVGPEHEMTLKARDELVRAVEILARDLGPAHEVTTRANAELADIYAALGDHPAAAATRKRQYEPQTAHLGAGHAVTLAAAGKYGDALALAGRWPEAIAVVTAAAQAADKDAGCDRKALAELLRTAARLQLAVEDYSPSEAAVRRALVIDSGEHGGGVDAAALDDVMLVQIAAARGEFDPTHEPFLKLVEQLRDRVTAVGSDDGGSALTLSLRGAAGVLLDAGAAEAGAELYTLALKADEARGASAASQAAEDQLGLARCLLANGDAAAATVLGEQALKTQRRLNGPSHPLCLLVGMHLTEAALKTRQTDDAAALARRLIERKCPRLGKKEDERLARLFDSVAALLEKAGRGPDAERLRGDFIRLRARQFGEGHEYVAEAYVNLANARQAAGGYADAVALYLRGIELQEAALGKSHPDIASTLLPLARTYRALKQNVEAAAALRRALGLWEQTAGIDHPVTLATVKQLALAELGLGNRQAAVPLMDRLLAAYDKDPDTPVGDMVRLLTRLAEVRGAQGEKDVARRHLQRAVALEQQLATQQSAAEAVGGLAELARVQRLLSDEDGAQLSLAAARALAAKMQDAEAQQSRIESIAAVREPVPPVNPPPASVRPELGPPSQSPQHAERLSDRIEAAWKELRAGNAAAARADLAAALAAEQAAGRGAEISAADLLMGLADMREQPLDEIAGQRQYERAVAIRRAALGAGHPLTIVAALRVGACGVARRDPAAAAEIAAVLVAPAVDAAAADPVAARDIRAAVSHAFRVAIAAGDVPATTTLLESGARLVDPRDLPTVVTFLDHVAELETLAPGEPEAAAIRTAMLRAVAAAGKPTAAHRGAGRLLMHQSLQARAAGDAALARSRAEAALAADRAEFGAVHPATAAALLRLSALDRSAGHPAAAEKNLAASREAAATLPAAPLAPWFDSLRRLLGLLIEQEQADEAVRLARHAIDSEARATGPRSPMIPVLLGDAARAYRLRGNTDTAMELLAEAIPLASEAAGGGSAAAMSLAVMLDRLKRPGSVAGRASVDDGRAAPNLVAAVVGDLRARALLPAATNAPALQGRLWPPFVPVSQSPLRLRMAVERDADGMEDSVGERSVSDWLRIGWERHCLGDGVLSQDAFAAAVRRAEAAAATPGAHLLEALQESALAALDRGDLTTARGALSRLGSLLVAVRGADDPAVADVAIQLADLVLPTGDLKYAAKMLDRARGIRIKRSTVGSIEAVAVTILEARLAATQGELQAARERLAAVRETLGEAADTATVATDPRSAWLRLAAARLAVRLGDFAAAGELVVAARRAAVGIGARLEAALLATETEVALRAGDMPAAERAAWALLALARTGVAGETAEPLALAGLARAAAAGDPAEWRVRADRAVAGLTTALDGMGPECWARDPLVAALDLAELLATKGEQEQSLLLGQAAARVAEACLAASDEDVRRARAVAGSEAPQHP